MRDYVGPLLDPLPDDTVLESAPCNGDWRHSGAAHHTIASICVGRRIRLTRRKLSPSHDEIPGVVEGQCYGSSHNVDSRIILAVELDNGECVGVDVTNPDDWSWEVS